MGICSFSAPQPIGVSFRFRKCKFRNISRNAIQHSAVDMGSGLTTPARDFHRARSPRLQASRWHPRVAKGTSIDPLARGPSTEPLLGQGRVARLSGSGVKPVSCRCFGRTSARHPRLEASRWHPGVARQSSIGSSSIKCRCFMEVEVRMGFLSMKCRYSMDIEVRIGCLSIKCRCFMDVEVRMGFSARCPACGNSRLYRNVAELSSLPFLPNEGACPNHPFSSHTLHP